MLPKKWVESTTNYFRWDTWDEAARRDYYEAILADARKWRALLNELYHLGYGPAITPEQIAALIPAADTVATTAEASRIPPTPETA